MALRNFRAAPLPNPPGGYDAQYFRQLVRILENYFSQLDSRAPNFAESYTADLFLGTLAARPVTTTEKAALPAEPGWVVFDTTLGKLCVYTSGGWETITSS